jgi:predicted DNA binding protein
MDGIRAEIKVHSPSVCPVVSAAAAVDAPVTDVSRAPVDSRVVEEFVVDTESVSDPERITEHGVEEIFSYGSKQAYRFERSTDGSCPCEDVESFGLPLLDTHVRNDTLVLAFHTPNLGRLQDTLHTLREQYSNVTVHRLVRTDQDASGEELVFVDRSQLTDRQREVLETAHEMGYFDHPKGANASEVAEELGIISPTFLEHLAAAQRKLFTAILDA